MPGNRSSASFRDPSGYVFEAEGTLFRQVNPVYLPHYERLMESGLYADLVASNLLVSHERESGAGEDGALLLRPLRLPFISYPYEWSFGQLKAAALATLDIQLRSLAKGMSLKDASAYNIQFLGGRPILIDTLSFEIYEEGAPWIGYRQFCEHFLAPLVLMADVDVRLGRLLREYLDGVPVDLASRLAPAKTRFNPGLALHLHAHAKAQTKAGEGSPASAKGHFGKTAMLGMIDSLRSTVERLEWRPEGTVWADYYSATNYSDAAFAAKHRLVGDMLDLVTPKPTTVWDLGANTGEFSKLAAERGAFTVAWDIDPAAVERNFRANRENERMLPLLQDLTSPSPGLGWANRERDSLAKRGPAGAVMALALIHHLAIGNNVPLDEVARYFHELSDWAIVEFVPKDDSQVQRLLSTRKDIYVGYSLDGFREAFAPYFETVRQEPVEGSKRTLFLLRRRPA